jgi:hypothetical protein
MTMFKLRIPVSRMLVAVMFAVTLINGAGDAFAQPRRERKPPASTVRGEDFYRGIYMAQGPVAERIPEIRDHMVVKQAKQHPRITRLLNEFSARLIKSIQEVDPSFLDRFGAAMQSGDHYAIDQAIAEGSQITVQAIRNLPEIATLRAKVEQDPKYVDKLIQQVRASSKGEVDENALREAINLVAASRTADAPTTELASAAIVFFAAAAVVAATYLLLAHAAAAVFNIAGAVTMVTALVAWFYSRNLTARSLHREQLVNRIATTRF